MVESRLGFRWLKVRRMVRVDGIGVHFGEVNSKIPHAWIGCGEAEFRLGHGCPAVLGVGDV